MRLERPGAFFAALVLASPAVADRRDCDFGLAIFPSGTTQETGFPVKIAAEDGEGAVEVVGSGAWDARIEQGETVMLTVNRRGGDYIYVRRGPGADGRVWIAAGSCG